MIGYVPAPGAFGRTRAMARAAGVDLTAAVVDGWLTRPELESLIRSCVSCGRSDACDPAAPAECANRATLAALHGD